MLIRGAFKLHDTHGVPLGVTLMVARARGVGVDVPAFYRDALAHGWKEAKALATIREALCDAGVPPAHLDVMLGYLKDGPA